MFSSREGVTLDSIAAPLSRLLLNPILTVPAALALSLSNSSIHAWVSSNAGGTRIQTLSSLLAVASVVLSLNSYLDRQFANNWVSDKTWNWDEEIVLVTGGSGGIGASICKHFLARNPRTRVVVIDYAPLGWKPEQEGIRLSYYQCDLSDTSALKATCERIRNEVGHPTVLFNNAGLVRGASVMEGSYGDIEATVRTNLIAPMLLVKEFIPEMVKRDHGHILHTGSLSCITPPAMVADYSATKAGLVAMHEVSGLCYHANPKQTKSTCELTLESPIFVMGVLVSAIGTQNRLQCSTCAPHNGNLLLYPHAAHRRRDECSKLFVAIARC